LLEKALGQYLALTAVTLAQAAPGATMPPAALDQAGGFAIWATEPEVDCRPYMQHLLCEHAIHSHILRLTSAFIGEHGNDNNRVTPNGE